MYSHASSNDISKNGKSRNALNELIKSGSLSNLFPGTTQYSKVNNNNAFELISSQLNTINNIRSAQHFLRPHQPLYKLLVELNVPFADELIQIMLEYVHQDDILLQNGVLDELGNIYCIKDNNNPSDKPMPKAVCIKDNCTFYGGGSATNFLCSGCYKKYGNSIDCSNHILSKAFKINHQSFNIIKDTQLCTQLELLLQTIQMVMTEYTFYVSRAQLINYNNDPSLIIELHNQYNKEVKFGPNDWVRLNIIAIVTTGSHQSEILHVRESLIQQGVSHSLQPNKLSDNWKLNDHTNITFQVKEILPKVSSIHAMIGDNVNNNRNKDTTNNATKANTNNNNNNNNNTGNVSMLQFELDEFEDYKKSKNDAEVEILEQRLSAAEREDRPSFPSTYWENNIQNIVCLNTYDSMQHNNLATAAYYIITMHDIETPSNEFRVDYDGHTVICKWKLIITINGENHVNESGLSLNLVGYEPLLKSQVDRKNKVRLVKFV
jgi:hypothetical protein